MALLGVFYFVSTGAWAQKAVDLALGLAVSPYIMRDTDNGIELDIIRGAFAYKGYTVDTHYFPFIEIGGVFASDEHIDAIATVEEKIGFDGYFSDRVITYRNYAATLKDKNIEIDSIADLSSGRVTAFQLATKYLGNEFARAVIQNPYYREKQDHNMRLKLFYQGRIDVLITDKIIFNYYRANAMEKLRNASEVVYHDIFPPNHYKVVFREKKLRDEFNEGLKHLKSTGEYEKIFDKYVKR